MTRSSVKFPHVCARPKQAWHDRAGSRARNDASPLHIHFYASARSFKACFAVGGFHEFIFDPTTNPEQRWIYSFTPWISPGVFGGGVQDVTSLSHETSAALNDPFGNNIVPTRQFPVFPDFARQTWRLATPVELLSTSTVPIPIKERGQVFQYHPQTEALQQWCEIGNASHAIGGAYSYPDTTPVPLAATPCPF